MNDQSGISKRLRTLAQYLPEQRSALTEAANRIEELEARQARAERAEGAVDVLESNGRVQAKLLVDTGRRVEELETECRILREVMNSPSEPDVIRLHREKCDALDRVFALEEALRFYADPFAWKKQHDPGDDVRVPDFYSETSFGDTALAVLPRSSGVARVPT